MKKRVLLIIAVGLVVNPITVLGFIANEGKKADQQDFAACNAGKIERCAEVDLDIDKITNPEYLAQQKEKAAQEKRERVADRAWMYAEKCGESVKRYLNDPDSYRYIQGGVSDITDTHINVWAEYSGTNAFGGRVRQHKTCKFSL